MTDLPIGLVSSAIGNSSIYFFTGSGENPFDFEGTGMY